MDERIDVIEHGWRRVFVTLAVIVAAMIEIIDTTVINVALPTVQGNLGATVTEGSWVVTGYIIANVIVIPLTPWLQTRFGRKNYFVASIVVFTIASLLCGVAGSLGMLVAFRILQGLAGGGLIATAQTILQDTYPREQQGLATGIFAMGVIVGPAVGPVIGGVLTDELSWRWAFYINLPIGIFAASLAWAFLRDPEKPRIVPVDIVGLGLLIVGLGSMQYVLDQGQRKDWFSDAGIVTFTALSISGTLAFILWELFGAKNPIVDLRVLRYRALSIGSLMSLALGFALFGGIVLIPQFVQGVLGFTATMSGQLFLVQAGTSGVLTFVAVGMIASGKIQARYQVAFGFAMMGLGNLLLTRVESPTMGFANFVLPLMILGLGMSQLFVPLTVATLGAVPESAVAGASAFTNLARQLGGSVATALLVTIQERASAGHYADLAGTMRLDRPGVSDYVASTGGAHAPGLAQQLFGFVQTQAVTQAYIDAALVTALVSLALAPFALFMGRNRAGMPSASH